MGATDANLWHDTIDVSSSTGAIVVGGSTYSASLIGAGPITYVYPHVTYYEPTMLKRQWSNYASLPNCLTRNIAFSPDGGLIIAYFEFLG